MHTPPINVSDLLKHFAAEFDTHLERYLRIEEGVPVELAEAVRYAALAPGKRVRPFLLVRCCELAGGRREHAWAAAAAIECVHAFSLVHDDLPAMDDDDLRRGQPTTHKKFGEALGILAGDALVVRAFEIVAREYAGRCANGAWEECGSREDDAETRRRSDAGTEYDFSAEQVALTPDPSPRGRGELDSGTRRPGDAEADRDEGDAQLAGVIALELARAAGWAGMIGGQADDLAGQRVEPSIELTRSIHARKTGKLFEAACRMGAFIGESTGGQAGSGTPWKGNEGSRDRGIEGRDEGTEGIALTPDPSPEGRGESIERLGRFGAKLGEAFQIADDILDVTATAEELGKSPGKDAAADKQTYPRCVGVEASKAAAERAVQEAVAELEVFGAEADDLRALAAYVVDRNY